MVSAVREVQLGTNRKGQAMVELAIGMVAVALVVTTVVAFTEFIVDDLKAQGEYRPTKSSTFLKYILE